MHNLAKNKILRIALDIAIVLTMIWSYWWATWILVIVLLFFFPTYYEIIGWGIVYDALYGLSLPQFHNIPYIFTISSLVLFVIATLLKKYLVAYEE